MTGEARRLANKVRVLEDTLLRTKNTGEIDKIRIELRNTQKELQKEKYKES